MVESLGIIDFMVVVMIQREDMDMLLIKNLLTSSIALIEQKALLTL